MAITTRVIQRPEPGETPYLRATLKGMALTLRHMLKRKTVT